MHSSMYEIFPETIAKSSVCSMGIALSEMVLLKHSAFPFCWADPGIEVMLYPPLVEDVLNFGCHVLATSVRM